MRSLLSEYGVFLTELIAGSATLATIMFIWPLIREFMDTAIYYLI